MTLRPIVVWVFWRRIGGYLQRVDFYRASAFRGAILIWDFSLSVCLSPSRYGIVSKRSQVYTVSLNFFMTWQAIILVFPLKPNSVTKFQSVIHSTVVLHMRKILRFSPKFVEILETNHVPHWRGRGSSAA